MRHSKRAVHAAAVLGWGVPRALMTGITEVRAAALEEGLAAAEETLPRDVLVSMLLAVELASADRVDHAAFAHEVFLTSGLSKLKVSFAVC